MGLPGSATQDVQLDAVALLQAQLDCDNDAAGTILHNCDPLPTANFLAYLMADLLRGLHSDDCTAMSRGMDALRASVLSSDGD